MQPGQVQCARCGWRNNVGDRMCGGCGQPLVYAGSSFSAPSDASPTVAASSAVPPPPLPPLSAHARTATWMAPSPAQPQPYSNGSATVAAPSRAVPLPRAASAPSRATRRNCLGRALISLAIAALLMVVLLACTWAAFLRPAVHASFDRQLRADLAAQVDKIPAIPDGIPPITRTIPESAFNQQPNAQAGDLKDARIHLLPGQIIMTYRLWGGPGKITTHLVARNGRIFVQDTQVDGWLNQVESGAELQDALNESLARLPAQDYVESVVVDKGSLTITIRHA